MPSQKLPISLKKGALFIADAHYHQGLREELVAFLSQIKSPQIFLMGDISDLLVGSIPSTYKHNKKLIDTINSLAQKCEIIYLEGNHDFNLQRVFPHIQVIPRAQQPLYVKDGGYLVALAHGDIFVGKGYEFYRRAIENPLVLRVLNLFNSNDWIVHKIQTYNASKNLCKSIEGFEEFACKRARLYQADIVIEGHFHQACECQCEDTRYINLPSFGCDKHYMRYEGDATFSKVAHQG
ncbi:UDP-2,3-diacylglucosamine hydrolase [Nitratiruptor sp. YY09-18]|nr:UDP-2,3-diacylglucosamine hydrolase [Nitratiruptor sp. YY09-18]